jgi:uncharacterized phage protein gp47/JayE
VALSLQNFSTLVQNMAAAVQGAASQLLDLTVGSTLRAILESTASVVLWLQYLILIVLQGTRLATSTGTQCDTFGADFGFFRLPATDATGAVTFSRFTPTNSALIPVGAQVRTADGTQTFTVTTDTTNSLWSAALVGYLVPPGTATGTVPVVAVNAGAQGNIVAGAINLIVGAISGLDTVTNALAFTNGVNAETDAAFKARFINYINTRAEATVAAVNYAVTSVSQVVTDQIIEDYNPAGVYTPGSFTVYIDDGSGDPSSGLIATVSAAVNAVRACGIQYAVQGPALITANVTFTLTVSAGTVKSSILASVEAGVASYINALPMGASLPYTALAANIYSQNAGITNVSNLLVNGATADVGGGAAQVVRSGTIMAS